MDFLDQVCMANKIDLLLFLSFSCLLLTNQPSVPFGVVLIAGLYLAWPANVARRPRGLDAIRRIDFLGILLVVAACTFLVFALQEVGAHTFTWNHPVIVTALVISALSWLGFAAWELYLGVRVHPRIEPVIPFRLVGRVYSACVM